MVSPARATLLESSTPETYRGIKDLRNLITSIVFINLPKAGISRNILSLVLAIEGERFEYLYKNRIPKKTIYKPNKEGTTFIKKAPMPHKNSDGTAGIRIAKCSKITGYVRPDISLFCTLETNSKYSANLEKLSGRLPLTSPASITPTSKGKKKSNFKREIASVRELPSETSLFR